MKASPPEEGLKSNGSLTGARMTDGRNNASMVFIRPYEKAVIGITAVIFATRKPARGRFKALPQGY